MLSNFFIPIKEVNAQKLSIYRDSSNRLKLKIEGENEEFSIMPLRCFPLTETERYLSIFKVMSDGTLKEEIVLIDDRNQLNENSKKLFEEELNKHYSLARIKKIFSVDQRKETSRWHVETESGKQMFEVGHHNDIYMLQPNLAVIEDAQGNVFLIDHTRLDHRSLSLLEIYT